MDTSQSESGLCERCVQRPQGLEGHDYMLQSEDGAGPVPEGFIAFHCSLCRAPWARGYAGGGHFEWIPVVHRSGPGRPL